MLKRLCFNSYSTVTSSHWSTCIPTQRKRRARFAWAGRRAIRNFAHGRHREGRRRWDTSSSSGESDLAARFPEVAGPAAEEREEGVLAERRGRGKAVHIDIRMNPVLKAPVFQLLESTSLSSHYWFQQRQRAPRPTTG